MFSSADFGRYSAIAGAIRSVTHLVLAPARQVTAKQPYGTERGAHSGHALPARFIGKACIAPRLALVKRLLGMAWFHGLLWGYLPGLAAEPKGSAARAHPAFRGTRKRSVPCRVHSVFYWFGSSGAWGQATAVHPVFDSRPGRIAHKLVVGQFHCVKERESTRLQSVLRA